MRSGLVFGLLLLVGLSQPASAQQTYKPPQVASAGDAYIPYQVVFDGLFVLDVSLTKDGNVNRIDALRNPGSMLGAAEIAVRNWKFHPASKDGKPEPSRLTVSVVYRPPNLVSGSAVPQEISPVISPERSDSRQHDGYVPVGVLAFAYPDYPVNSVAWGSVVAQLTVGESGKVENVDFIQGMDVFNHLVSDALKKWQFQAATFRGRSVTSKTVVAFVFQAPSSN